LKGSSAISATAIDPARPTGRSSAPLSPTSAESFALAGPSEHPDPAHNAYRRDLADVALAGHVIASHYAEPLEIRLATAATLRLKPSDEAEAISELAPGTPFAMLENSRGWAWGYAGDDRRVGYVRSSAVTS
jgi:hypothetical protein